jgi:hypothetical protein
VKAPLAVAVEIRALDVGPRLLRCVRLSRAISEEGLTLELPVPFEAGRPVRVELTLPDDDPAPLGATGLVRALPPDDETLEGEASRPRGVSFTLLDPDARARIARYVGERLSQWPSP